jgi:PAT family beta-lactamase induction signal transducer AmpG
MTSPTAPVPRPKGWRLLRLALQKRKSATCWGSALHLACRMPLIWYLNAWLAKWAKLATIGVLSWIGLSYSFKFLWSPLVDRFRLPGLDRLGRRKSWILCQGLLVAGFFGLAVTDPAHAIGVFALFAFMAALASATQDVAIDAWRIDVADEETPVELLIDLSVRLSHCLDRGRSTGVTDGGRMSWSLVYMFMAGLIVLIAFVTFCA